MALKGNRRWPAPHLLPVDVEPMLKPGDYAYLREYKMWIVRAPNGDMGCLRPNVHSITEHEDKTITVKPSIQFETGARWHGWLERGEWRR